MLCGCIFLFVISMHVDKLYFQDSDLTQIRADAVVNPTNSVSPSNYLLLHFLSMFLIIFFIRSPGPRKLFWILKAYC